MAALRQKQRQGQLPMCPGSCARQLLLESAICSGLARLASLDTESLVEVGEQCVKGLMASELAVILNPSCCFEVRRSSHCGPTQKLLFLRIKTVWYEV